MTATKQTRSIHLAVAEAVYGDLPVVWRGPVTREEQQANRFAAFRAAELKALQERAAA